MTTVLEFKLGEREPGEPPPTRPCLPLTGREPGSQEEVGRAAPGGTGRWPPEHTNVEDSKGANGGLGIDKARPLCQDGHVDYNILQAGAAKLVAHGRTLTTDMFPLADFKSQISHQHLKPEEFTLKFSRASIPNGSFFSGIQTIGKSSFIIYMYMTCQLLEELCEIVCGFL